MEYFTSAKDCLFVASLLLQKFEDLQEDLASRISILDNSALVAVNVIPYCHNCANDCIHAAVEALLLQERQELSSVESLRSSIDEVDALYTMDADDALNALQNEGDEGNDSEMHNEIQHRYSMKQKKKNIKQKNINLFEFLQICQFYYDDSAELVFTIRSFESIFLPNPQKTQVITSKETVVNSNNRKLKK